MELLKLSNEWAKSEVFSTRFFIFFAILFFIASVGFWQMGKTDLAKAYIIPTLVAGVLLLIIGSGLLYTNIQRVSQFEKDYYADAESFKTSEITRCEAILKEYDNVVFRAIPIIIIVAALMIVLLSTPTWRAISITTIAMLIVILLVDGTAYARISNYYNAIKNVDITADINR